jgi:hypothetical protein
MSDRNRVSWEAGLEMACLEEMQLEVQAPRLGCNDEEAAPPKDREWRGGNEACVSTVLSGGPSFAWNSNLDTFEMAGQLQVCLGPGGCWLRHWSWVCSCKSCTRSAGWYLGCCGGVECVAPPKYWTGGRSCGLGESRLRNCASSAHLTFADTIS